MPRRLLLYRLRILAAISLIWLVFGFVFHFNLISPENDLGVQVSTLEFALTFSIIGFIISAALIFYLKPAFSHQPLWLSIIFKLLLTFLLFLAISFILLVVYYEIAYNGIFENYIESFFTKIATRKTFHYFIIEMGLMTLLSIIIIEITDKYGPGMFWSMLIGEYNKPKQENRIFIFLDINESTTIAEDLGHTQYFLMLRRFFRDITIPILANDGEIYQYVGDEIVITWPNTPENKIKSLKFIRNTYFLIERLKDQYHKRYGHVPRFKAGVHAGEITAGFIGVIKKELIYSGDTVNTTARIRSMCHDLDESFILSEDFMYDFHAPHGYTIEGKGEIELKGRSEPIKLFSMTFD